MGELAGLKCKFYNTHENCNLVIEINYFQLACSSEFKKHQEYVVKKFCQNFFSELLLKCYASAR